MAILRYGVLKAKAVSFEREDNDPTPHFQLQLEAGGDSFRVPVNVRSSLSPSQLVYLIDENFRHPITIMLAGLSEGFTRLPESDRAGLDYIRSNLFDLEAVVSLPSSLPGQDDDLQDILVSRTQTAIDAADDAFVFAFGEPFPGNADPAANIEGIHDIHMNQGNHPRFQEDDGVFHDGGLIYHFPSQDRFIAVFLAFQSQALHTDDQTGHALAGSRTFQNVIEGTDPDPGQPGERDGALRIVGALANPEGPEGQPGHTGRPESVTLLNTTPDAITLDGWAIIDRAQHRQALDGRAIEAGGAELVALDAGPVQLGNSGGTITLLDENGLQIDGVSYTRADARSGFTIVF